LLLLRDETPSTLSNCLPCIAQAFTDPSFPPFNDIDE
jgi:hypothetical protein